MLALWRTGASKALRILIGIVLDGPASSLSSFDRGDPLRRRLGRAVLLVHLRARLTCTNDFAGYTCDPLTLADVEFFGDVELPEDTHGDQRHLPLDPRLPSCDAVLAGAAPHAAAALSGLDESFGPCAARASRPR